MKDSLSAEQFITKLQTMQTEGLFRQLLPGDPKKPQYTGLSFSTAGNYVLVSGDPAWVDAAIESIRLMAFLSERPRAHVQLNVRVVQITGPANTDVIQMSDAVRTLVDTQRNQIVRAFSDLQYYLIQRLKARPPDQLAVYDEVRKVLPNLGKEDRPLTVPETLLLLMIDRALPAPSESASTHRTGAEAESALEALPQKIGAVTLDPHTDEAGIAQEVAPELAAWRRAVTAAYDWCAYYSAQLSRRGGIDVGALREALQRPDCPLPSWLALRLTRSLDLTARLYPDLERKQTVESLAELERRFRGGLDREATITADIARYSQAASGQGPGRDGARAKHERPEQRRGRTDAKGAPEGAGTSTGAQLRPGYVVRRLLELKDLAEDLVAAPLALVESVGAATDDSGPTLAQLVDMFRHYAEQRALVDSRLDGPSQAGSPGVNYDRLQNVEAALDLWLRRASDSMERALEQHFYNRYVEELRLLANNTLTRTSSRDILSQSEIEDVPDVTRDLLLADTGVNLFVSNSVSMQFEPDTMNSVNAEVQSELPNKLSLLERINQASEAQSALQHIQAQYGIAGKDMIEALLAGGEAVPVRAGITLQAKPSIGLDDSVVTLTMTANETLQPDTDKVTDRVTRHSIDNATITVLSYEPTVLSTLTSNISYYENSGGLPVLRQVPGLKNLLGDVPFAPFKMGKRKKGVYQSSVIILEPVVIPTIEDLVRYDGGWRGPAGK